MAKTQEVLGARTGAALTKRESRRVAELIVRSHRARTTLGRPSHDLPGLSLRDARIIRDEVVGLSVGSGQLVGAVCVNPLAEPMLVGGEMLNYGSTRILSADDRLQVLVLAGVRGTSNNLALSDGESEIVLGLAVLRRPYDSESESLEDLVCANGGLLQLAVVSLPGTSALPAIRLVISSAGESRQLDTRLIETELRRTAHQLLLDAEALGGRVGQIALAPETRTEMVILLGTPLSEPLAFAEGTAITLYADQARLLEVTADPGHFI